MRYRERHGVLNTAAHFTDKLLLGGTGEAQAYCGRASEFFILEMIRVHLVKFVSGAGIVLGGDTGHNSTIGRYYSR